MRPFEDTQQDWALIEGVEIDGYTIFKFKRRFETCDKPENDKDITVCIFFIKNSHTS